MVIENLLRLENIGWSANMIQKENEYDSVRSTNYNFNIEKVLYYIKINKKYSL